jgi:signal transduction histidine kinase
MIIKIILFLVIFFNLLLSLLVLIHNYKSINNRIFSIIGILASIWTFTNYMTSISNDGLWLKSSYAFGSLVLSSGLIWILFTLNPKISRYSMTVIFSSGIFFFLCSFLDGFIISKSNIIYKGAIFSGKPGIGLSFYTLYFIIVSFLIFWKLYSHYKVTIDRDKKYQIKYILIGSLITLITSGLSSFILPHFSIFLFGGIDSLGFLLFLISLAYSITKYRLFDIKLVAIEIGILSLWSIILIRLSLATSNREIYTESILFLITVILGILLILTSLREAKQREELAHLNLHLNQKVEEQTKEIVKSLELEKKAKRDLEKLNETKDQFIMLTQHNLRTPITSIDYEIESILSTRESEISSDVRQTLLDTKTSIKNLTRLVDDFLNITTLKVGSQILNLGSGSLLTIIESVIQELRIDILNRNISIEYPKDLSFWPEMKVDLNKIREVFQIIIENAVKYNFLNGKISIETKNIDGSLEIKIKNTGVGIIEEDKRNIFDKLFYRSKESRASNPTGMGIGLSISRMIVKAHHGELEIYSDGENKGAEVTITLPINFLEKI